MKKRRVIHSGNLPATLPINRTIVLLIALDYWKANMVCTSFVIGYLLIYWALTLTAWYSQLQTDISEKVFWESRLSQDTAD